MCSRVIEGVRTMLVAYGPDDIPVLAEEARLAQLLHWSREHQLYCPNCRAVLHVRGGAEKRTQLHFAHQKGECAWSTEPESLRHMQGKRVLAEWLQTQFPQAIITLEERLPEPNRIADIFVRHADDQHWAIEFQCAPLDIAEWKRRHRAYQQAGIRDLWIIGVNRREKQEAFIEAIFGSEHEILFLDPQVTPARIWLRWLITAELAQEWQQIVQQYPQYPQHPQHPHYTHIPILDGLAGHTGYGALLMGTLPELTLDAKAHLEHPIHTTLEHRSQLLHNMQHTSTLDEAQLTAYLQHLVPETLLRHVLHPLIRAYLRDPDLLRRYNYGRGLPDVPSSKADQERIQQARHWLAELERQGFRREDIREMLQVIPPIGVYAAFTHYIGMLTNL